jgi:hypothetical protein
MYSVLAAAINHPDEYNQYKGLFNHRMLKSLADRGVELDVVSPRPFAPPVGPYSAYSALPQIESSEDYDIHHPRFWYLLPKRLFYAASGNSYARRVPSYVKRTFEPPDVVHACHIYPDGYGMLPYVREIEVPLFVVAHGAFLNSFNQQPPGVRAKLQKTLDRATGVICVSDALTQKAAQLTDPAKVTTVPIGADPKRFPVARRPQLREELEIPAETTVVLFVGQFIERKGVDDIAALLPELELEDTVFAFVGHEGGKERKLRQALDESGFPSQHVYTEMDSAPLRRWFAIADLLLLPSYDEGRPTVIYEAMASKTAVLASAVGGVPEQVEDGETGWVIPPGDRPALRSALQELTEDTGQLERFGEAGLQRLQAQNWTWKGHSARIRDLHLSVINGRPAAEHPTDQS